MNIQIFGTKKCNDTKKAERFFKERRLPLQWVDMKKHRPGLRELQLFAAVRPIRIPDKGIDWTFFRENIEGEYILGNRGIRVGDELAIDFKVCTKPGAERIARAAFDFARKTGKHTVTVVTKAKIVKLVDGEAKPLCMAST